MHGRKIILAFCLICFVSSGSREQQPPRPKPGSDGSRAPQPVPPPPKPVDDGPSLQVTVKFIQDKLSESGPITYTLTEQSPGFEPTVDTCTQELSNVVADPQRCIVSYHVQPSSHLAKMGNYDVVLDLKEVKKITVESVEESLNDLGVKSGQFVHRYFRSWSSKAIKRAVLELTTRSWRTAWRGPSLMPSSCARLIRNPNRSERR